MIVKLLWIASWLTVAAHVCAGPAPGQETAPPRPFREPLASTGVPASEPGTVTLNFDGADLVEVVHVLARHLRLNYTIDRDVSGEVTLFSGQPVRKDDLLPIFHEVLRIHGAMAVRQENLYRITSVSKGVELARPGAARGSGFAMRVLPVRFFSAAAMKRLLEPFLSEGGTVLEGVRGNYLVLADLPSNIRRLSEIMTLIDHRAFAGARMEMYEPKAAPARVLAREMAAAMSLSAASEAQEEDFAARFLPLPRINRLLVIAYSEAAWNHVKHWIERIDVAAETPGRKVFIRPVENGKAAELARVLEQVYGSDRSSSDPGPPRDGSGSVLALPSDGEFGLHDLGRSTEWFDGDSGLHDLGHSTGWFDGGAEAPALPDSPAGAARDVNETSSSTPSRSQEDEAEGDGVRVVAEPATNSLVILATRSEYLDMEEVLGRLDQIPRQVLMEVLVAEVTLTDDFEFGVEYALSQGGFGSRVSEGEGSSDELAGTGFRALGAGFASVIEAGRDFRVFVNALMQDARVKVLSSPHLLAVDNRPARIRVGSEQPVATGTVVSQEAQATTTTIQFRNVGRILSIVPQVNSEGLVNLQVRVEVSDVGERVVVGRQSFNAFNVRDAETTAVLQDGQTLVIGGIITDSVRRTRLGIPLLMDFPILGPLFRTDIERSERTELVILITPRVIRNRQEGESVTDRFLDQVRAVRRELEAGWTRPSSPASAPR